MYRRSAILAIIFLLVLAALSAVSSAQDDGPARKLLNSQGCKACHALEGEGGNLAISFEVIRANLSRAEIRQKLVNQEQRHANGSIPDFSHLSEENIEALVVFLQPRP